MVAILTRELHAGAKGVSAGSLNFERLAESGSLKSIWKLGMLRSLVDLGAWYSLKLFLPGTSCEFQQIWTFFDSSSSAPTFLALVLRVSTLLVLAS